MWNFELGIATTPMEGGHSWPPSSERLAGQERPASFAPRSAPMEGGHLERMLNSDILKSSDRTAVEGNRPETENCIPEGGHSCPPSRVRQENQRESASWNGQLESLVQGTTVAKRSVVAPPKNDPLIRFPDRSGCLKLGMLN